jgi:uncharacterized protein YndB with AHSA1/START domain
MNPDNRPEHIYTLVIAATPERIWQALTSKEFTRQYFYCTDVESDWQPGSRVAWSMPDGQLAVDGEVLAASPPTHLAVTWQVHYDEDMEREAPSRVQFDIESMESDSDAPVCRLTVTHDRFAPDSKVFPSISQGWGQILCSLKTLLETGQALPILGPARGSVRGSSGG